MRQKKPPPPKLRWAVIGAGLLLIVYLAVIALHPAILDALPRALGWFGRPGSMPTLGISVALLIWAWVLTIPASAVLAAIGWWLGHRFF